MFAVFAKQRRDRCLPCNTNFFMQVDIWADGAVGKPVNNAGLTENLSYREKKNKHSLSDSAHLSKSIGSAFSRKALSNAMKVFT